MRRTVKAWIRLEHLLDYAPRGWCCWAFSARGEREKHRVPVTITYDDGRPAPRKRTKGGR